MNKKAISIIIGSIVLVVGVGVGVYLIGQDQDFRGRAAPATTIELVSSTSSPRVSATFVVSALIDTGSNDAIAAELYFEFDPTKVEVLDVEDGGFFSNPQIVGPNIDNVAGEVGYITYTLPGSGPSSGTNEVIAKLIVKAKEPGSATFSLSPRSIVGAIQENAQNVLVNSVSTVVNVQEKLGEEDAVEAGGGGEDLSVATATPTTIAPTATPTTFYSSTVTPTVFLSDTDIPEQLPDTGVAEYTVFGIILGVLLLVGSLALVL